MKLVQIALLASITQAHRIISYPGVTFMPQTEMQGVDKDDIFANQAPHWRHPWPEGVVDNGDDDESVFSLESSKRRSHKPPKKAETYPWAYDEDVVHTGKSIALAESNLGLTLSTQAVLKDRGHEWAFNNYDHDRKYKPETNN